MHTRCMDLSLRKRLHELVTIYKPIRKPVKHLLLSDSLGSGFATEGTGQGAAEFFVSIRVP